MKKRAAVIGLISAAVAGLVVLPAVATPGAGFTPTPLSKGLLEPVHVNADRTEKWDLQLRTKAESDVGVDRLNVAVGGQSGWHTHAGITIVTVVEGQVQWYDGSDPICTPTTYRAGDSFVEPANHIHLVRNTSGTAAELIAVQIRPEGTPGRIDASKPTNCPTIP